MAHGGATVLLALWMAAAWASETAYRIGPRDVVHVEVYGEPALTADATVDTDGAVVLTHVGAVPIAGLTPVEAAERIRVAYLDGWLRDPTLTVRVAEHRAQKVEVYGAVKKPGPYYLRGPTSLREMLGEAGWLDAQKASRRVSVARIDGTTLVVTVDDIMAPGDSAMNVELRPGDVVNVAEDVYVYVAGAVKNPGEVSFREGMTATQAVSEVGGWTSVAALANAYVLRGEDKLPVNLRRIQRGKAPDVVLLVGDRLILRESAF
jgi:polysaccharide export outer membrane protein